MINKNDVKLYLWITDNSQDDLLDQIIKKAKSFAESYCNQILEKPTENITEVHDLTINQIFLYNILNVSIKKVYENTWTDFSITWEDKTWDWRYFLEKFWVLTFNYTKNIVNAIKVEYLAWYDENSIPDDLKQGLIELSALFYRKSEWKALKSETIDWDRVEFEVIWWVNKDELPTSIITILDKYRKYDISS